MADELKPCPFCGSRDVAAPIADDRFNPKSVHVHCNDCGASGPQRGTLARMYPRSHEFWWNDRAEHVPSTES